ncbi:TonB-dependent receptor [Halioxenophilus sp. WMMB6]|uniref:TonB-dependent receptor n=1 Tax=Halioxenophilus sp. WMMB6 TaxID=3073815 RepID=UPI00295F099A|nr:TonB-dependent receptor [Halioxenophilus sp. WMMB6]
MTAQISYPENNPVRATRVTCSLLALSVASAVMAGVAQAEPAATSSRAANAFLEEVVVQATKKSDGQALQDAPLSVSAMTGDQIEARQILDLKQLGFTAPNVILEDIGTFKGTANFSIRGMGVNSSIPSIEPTVGTFIDGIYLGVSQGVITDFYDLEGVEVLRGPQGLLFGRNVTGGAVLITTSHPTDEFTWSGKTSYESGNQYTVASRVSGPLVEGRLNGKLSVYYSDDSGWFQNEYDGSDVGASETLVVRPALEWMPTDSSDVLLRYEHGDVDGDGAVPQDQSDPSLTGFKVRYDEVGYNKVEWDQFTVEANVDVGFGDGTITNIAGWRALDVDNRNDVDATATPFLDFFTVINQEQFSNELRYEGSFFNWLDLTVGAYYFTQEIDSLGRRIIGGGAIDDHNFGGVVDVDTYAVFSQGDIAITDYVTLNLGVRYTKDKKSADVASPGHLCDFDSGSAKSCDFDFSDSHTWDSVTPKIGFGWAASEELNVYGFYTKGFRSGGYNVRGANVLTNPPGPFDQETMDSFELGTKWQTSDRHLTVNGALFHNAVKDLQRSVNIPDTAVGTIQTIGNPADATIMGFDLDVVLVASDSLVLTGFLGYVDGSYDAVHADMTGDGVIDSTDLGLDLPRLAPWSYGVGAVYTTYLFSSTELSIASNFAHRDATEFNENNTGELHGADMLSGSVSLSFNDGRTQLSLFGRNLLDEVTEGAASNLPTGGVFAPINEGRVFGLELKISN